MDGVLLDPPQEGMKVGKRWCAPRNLTVSMRFEKVFDSWRVTVSEGRRELRTFPFGDAGKVDERAERGNAFQDLAARQGFEYGLSCGLGRCDLWLTEEQYARLK